MKNYQEIIDKYYPVGSRRRDIYIQHCRQVADMALNISHSNNLPLEDNTVETAAMLHEGAAKSSQIERMSGYAKHVMARYPIGSGDCLLIASTSGINPFCMEMAELARERGAKVIGISSFAYLDKPSRQKDGKHLPEFCDICLNNHVPVGDATVTVCSDGTKAGPVSTIATLAIANAIVLEACEVLRAKGVDPKVFRSGNCVGSDTYNAALLEEFMPRVRHL